MPVAERARGSRKQDVCFRLAIGEEIHEGCVSTEDLQTGLTYIASRSHGGPIDVVGFVTDDVAMVTIGGQTVSVKNNVWHYTGKTGDDLSFAVSSADGSLSATRD